ncbi:hypothetical protein [Gallibacterium sp. ZY190522]
MKKIITIILTSSVLLSCEMGGFKPPKQHHSWAPGKQFYSPDRKEKFDFISQREKDMRACGMDPVLGESMKTKVNLCMEQKGWYLEKGPVCEERIAWYDPLCIEWRAKHSKPDAKPWD